MNPIYIIPARGGSKGIPRKNIKPLCGKPLLHYAIECARGAGARDSHIILSTDDAEIADCARGIGLAVPYMRPAELATDTAGSREVMLDAMSCAVAAYIAPAHCSRCRRRAGSVRPRNGYGGERDRGGIESLL